MYGSTVAANGHPEPAVAYLLPLMQDFFTHLLGLAETERTISGLQMSARMVLIATAALLMLRLSGRRTFGSGSPFDRVVTIILGAVLGRAVVAASPLWGTIGACFTLVLMHRLLGLAAAWSDALGRIIKGRPAVLARAGDVHRRTLLRHSLSERDLIEGLREAANTEDVGAVASVHLERSGRITVVKKEAAGQEAGS